MQKIRYRITTLSPVLFSQNSGDMNTVATFQFIPGSSILGAFAWEWIRLKKLGKEAHKDESFYQWFLSGNLLFSNAYITVQDENNRIHVCFPVPCSVQEDKDRAGIYDLLLKEKDDNLQTTAIGGFADIQGSLILYQDVRTSLNFHHARDQEKGISKKGQIFNYLSIDSGQSFEGMLTGQKDILDCFLKEFSPSDNHTFYLGRSRNTQYGKVKFEFLSQSPESFKKNTNSFDSDEISLTLLSDTIIYNDYGYSTTDVKELEKILGAKITKAIAKTSDVENYVSAWHLKRPSEKCYRAGSCFMLEVPVTSLEKLHSIEMAGIGERCGEGFGQCVFNMQQEDRLSKKNHIKTPTKPATPVPDMVKKALSEILEDTIRKKVELDALAKAKEFDAFAKDNRKPLPTKSLIGRLESMVKVMDREQFVAILNDRERLRKTAQDKLKQCRTGSETLHTFLTTHNIDQNHIKQVLMNNELSEIARITEQNPERDIALQIELYRLYFLTFFAAMRKKINRGKEVAQ